MSRHGRWIAAGLLACGIGCAAIARVDVIGAVGAGGAPGGHLDEQCAVAGINTVKDQLQ